MALAAPLPETFAQAGAKVIICARAQDKRGNPKAIQDAGGDCTIEVLDLSDARAFGALVEKYAQNGLDILINNAPHVGYGMINDTDLDDFQVNFSINVNAAYTGIQAAMKHMAAKGGSIINISSINGARAMQGMSGYSASKAALDHLTRAAAMEGARQNIRVNGIAPGPIMTPGTEVFLILIQPRAKPLQTPTRWGASATRKKWRKSPCFWHRICPLMLMAQSFQLMAAKQTNFMFPNNRVLKGI